VQGEAGEHATSNGELAIGNAILPLTHGTCSERKLSAPVKITRVMLHNYKSIAWCDVALVLAAE
jgi:hypothetical protein